MEEHGERETGVPPHQPYRPDDDVDPVEEASETSFPASDPPPPGGPEPYGGERGGSGTAGERGPADHQAGAYARDAHQDPEEAADTHADADQRSA